MKIFRGPKTSDKWKETDAKPVKAWMAEWQPGSKLRFDGTIDKTGERHTDLGVELTEKDIVLLHDGLLKYYRNSARLLQQERDQLHGTVRVLEEVMTKISALVSYKRGRAPNTDALLDAVQEVSDHFRWSHRREETFRSRFPWLKWKSL